MSLLVFLVFFILGSTLGMFMQTASLEEEFTGAAAAAAFLGRDWTGVMSPVGSISGFLRGIPYLPTMLCPDPVFQYKLFMLINSAAYALIPLSAFRLTDKLGVTKLWQRLLVTALCGIFPSVLIYSHYLLSEPLSTVFVWLLLLVIFRSEKENGKKAGAFFASVTAGLLTACAYFLSPSCAGVFLAVCLLLSLCKARRSQKKHIFQHIRNNVYTSFCRRYYSDVAHKRPLRLFRRYIAIGRRLFAGFIRKQCGSAYSYRRSLVLLHSILVGTWRRRCHLCRHCTCQLHPL